MLHINKVHKEDHMYAAFSYFDKDGSGYITADELHEACEKFGLGDIHLDEVMRDIDKDNVIIFPSLFYILYLFDMTRSDSDSLISVRFRVQSNLDSVRSDSISLMFMIGWADRLQ